MAAKSGRKITAMGMVHVNETRMRLRLAGGHRSIARTGLSYGSYDSLRPAPRSVSTFSPRGVILNRSPSLST
jgi:hypothetical protein